MLTMKPADSRSSSGKTSGPITRIPLRRLYVSHLDILLERLRHYDEVTLLELLDVDADEILERFKDKVLQRRSYIMRELELLEDDESIDELDGFQIETVEDWDEEE